MSLVEEAPVDAIPVDEEELARARRARFAKISSGRTAIRANDDYLSGKVPLERKQRDPNAPKPKPRRELVLGDLPAQCKAVLDN